MKRILGPFTHFQVDLQPGYYNGYVKNVDCWIHAGLLPYYKPQRRHTFPRYINFMPVIGKPGRIDTIEAEFTS